MAKIDKTLILKFQLSPNHRWTAAIVSKRHGSILYEVEVGQENRLRQHNQLRPIHSGTCGASNGIPLLTLLNTFNMVGSLPFKSTPK